MPPPIGPHRTTQPSHRFPNAKVRRSRLAVCDRDVLGDLVVFHGFVRQVFAKSGLLETAVRRLRSEWHVVVDPHCSELEVLTQPHSATHVFGPHGRGQPVDHVISKAQRLSFILKRAHRDHWTKYLGLDDLRVLRRVGYHSGLVIITTLTPMFRKTSTRNHGGILSPRLLHQVVNPVTLHSRDQRAHLYTVVKRISQCEAAHRFNDCFSDHLGLALSYIHARGGSTILPG